MSERYDREKETRHEVEDHRTLGPNIDAEGRRMDEPRGNDGPEQAGGPRAEREPREERGQHGAQRRGDGDRGADAKRGTSWISALIGMLTALGAALLLSGIVGGLVALISLALVGAGGSETSVGISSLIGVLLTLFLAYLVGGYAAGRMASRKGSRHGLLTALLGVLVTILLVVIGTIAGIGISENLSGVVLPDVPEDSEQGVGSVLALSAISGILILIFPFIGGAIGGAWGARTGRRRP